MVPSDSDILEQVRDVWSEVLGPAELLPDADFFDLGGTSLQALRVVTRLRERLGLPINPVALFEHPGIAAFSQAIIALRDR